MRWAHNETVVVHRGRCKVFCTCGAQSERISPDQVSVWITKHRFKVGIRPERKEPDASASREQT